MKTVKSLLGAVSLVIGAAAMAAPAQALPYEQAFTQGNAAFDQCMENYLATPHAPVLTPGAPAPAPSPPVGPSSPWSPPNGGWPSGPNDTWLR